MAADRHATVRGIVTSLANRLRLQRLTTDRPEILHRPVPAPAIIVGLPRSGTTVLHPAGQQLWEVKLLAAGRRRAADRRRPRRMTAWLADNRQHKHGVHHYAAGDFDLDVAAWRDRFGFYYDRYGVRPEP